MKRVAAVVAVAALGLAACSDGSPEPNGDDVLATSSELPGKPRWVKVDHPEGYPIWCLYLYKDNGYDGGPALWCDATPRGDR